MSKQSISRVLFFEKVTLFRNNGHSSSLAVAGEIKRPTRELERTTHNVPLFGFAPGGVYKASAVTGGAGELLPHPFTLTRHSVNCQQSGVKILKKHSANSLIVNR